MDEDGHRVCIQCTIIFARRPDRGRLGVVQDIGSTELGAMNSNTPLRRRFTAEGHRPLLIGGEFLYIPQEGVAEIVTTRLASCILPRRQLHDRALRQQHGPNHRRGQRMRQFTGVVCIAREYILVA